MQVDSSGSIASLVQSSQDLRHTSQAKQEGSPNAAQQTPITGTSDTVTLTSAAAQLSQLEQVIKEAPVADSRRIEQIQSALKTGHYDRDAGQVAGKLLNFESALNSARFSA